MINRHLKLATLSLSLASLIACSQNSGVTEAQSPVAESPSPTPTQTVPSGDLTRLFSRIWKVSDAPSEPAPGSIYIFLANGTLLETSCVETYRIATWTIDKETPDVLRVVEDGQLVFTAAIADLTDTTLKLHRTLVPGNEEQDITLTSVDQEFVCPDLPK